ncbi:hypothetical protein [Corynebacterium sp. A21]|uniref:hypothetical protein n=1 Tax=Corynebacterium sp. A21 TaxID=3457318 RepID=UPI003FD2733E
MDRNGTWWVPRAFIAARIILLALYFRDEVSGPGVLGLIALQYLVFTLILPSVVKHQSWVANSCAFWW